MNGSRFDCFNEQVWPHQDAEGHLHDRASSSLDLMPPARVIAGPRATPHFHCACYEGALSGIGGWRANPRTRITPGAETSFRVPAAPSRNATYVTGCAVPWFSSPKHLHCSLVLLARGDLE